MSAHKPLFSILIPSWNNLPYLKNCIQSLRKNSRFTHQIIVHLNEGIDGSLEWLQSQTDVLYTHSPENIGICYAVNTARRLVTTDYMMYANDDMYFCPDWDQVLWDEIQTIGHHRFFLSSTLIEPHATGNACVIVQNYGSDLESFNEEKLLSEFKTFQKADWQGATWPPNIVHRDLWDLIGGYSIEFFPGFYSDPDFSMKLWQAGVRHFKGVSQSRVYHFGSKSTRRFKKQNGYYTFIQKWKITSKTFCKLFLKAGQAFDGVLKDPVLSRKTRWRQSLKRLISVWK